MTSGAANDPAENTNISVQSSFTEYTDIFIFEVFGVQTLCIRKLSCWYFCTSNTETRITLLNSTV